MSTEIEVTQSYRGFELLGFGQKNQKHLIKDLEVLCLYTFYCTISSNVRAEKGQNKTKA